MRWGNSGDARFDWVVSLVHAEICRPGDERGRADSAGGAGFCCPHPRWLTRPGRCRFVYLEMALPDSDYNDALLNATGQRNWLFLGLMLSLALHLLLCLYLYQTRFAPADLALAPRSQPPLFKVKPIDTQAALDKASLDQTNPAGKPEPDQTNGQIPR